MLSVLFVVAIAVVGPGIRAETVPCKTGSSECSGSLSGILRINGQRYCCDNGFSQFMSGRGCQCVRQFSETECLVGKPDCEGATSVVSSSNGTMMCCKNESGLLFHESRTGNETELLCTCRNNVGNGNVWSNGYVTIGSVSRPMTDEEKAAFEQWQKDFNASMQRFNQRLNQQMADLENSLSNLFKGWR